MSTHSVYSIVSVDTKLTILIDLAKVNTICQSIHQSPKLKRINLAIPPLLRYSQTINI